MRLCKEGAALDYRCAKQHSEPGSDKRGARLDELHLTPLELTARIAALVPPPHTHRQCYFGVLAPNSPLRAAVTALAQPAQPAMQVVVQAEPANMSEGAPGVVTLCHASSPTLEPAPPKRSPAHYLWAVLIARIYEVFPLLCPPAALYCTVGRLSRSHGQRDQTGGVFQDRNRWRRLEIARTDSLGGAMRSKVSGMARKPSPCYPIWTRARPAR